MLEAGGWDRDPWIHIPLGWGRILTRRLHDWMYFTEPEPQMNGRKIECARGKVIGGSSSINAMTYSRGHRGDYDRWAEQHKLPTWSYAHALPYFRKQETWEGGAEPLPRRRRAARRALLHLRRAAGRRLYWRRPRTPGCKWNDDLNGPDNAGIGRNQNTIRNGRRCSAAVAYLRPAMARGNLTVEVSALVSRIVIEGGRAVGVEYRQGGETHRRARQPRGDARRRRDQLAAGADAVRHRRPRRAARPRHQAARCALHRRRTRICRITSRR